MSKTIEAWELSAYVDGDLPPDRMTEIETAAECDAGLRRHLDELLADHRALQNLGQIRNESLGELPPRLERLGAEFTAALDRRRARRGRRPAVPLVGAAWRQVAGLAAAAAVGWAAASWAAPHTDALSSFIDEATEVHRTAALAPGFSREASTAAIDSLRRLFTLDLTPPDLTDAGFALSRIDVAATDTGPAAVFLYTDPEARRVSLVLSLDSPTLDALGPDDAAPRVTTHDGLAVSFGRRRGVAFALVGPVPEPTARLLAGQAVRALTD